MSFGHSILHYDKFKMWYSKYGEYIVYSGYKTDFIPDYVFIPNKFTPLIYYYVPLIFLRQFKIWLYLR